MSASNRAAQIAKTHKVLAKHFKPIQQAERPVLEQLLYACCLENTRYEIADEIFARLQESMFDWNEVRVTTVRELTELMKGSADPSKSATQLKHTLHSVFESVYSFDVDLLKKQNLGAAIKQLESYRGTTTFSISYLVQNGLGGHSIPLCKSSMNVLYIADVASEDETKKGRVPGLERAIPKTKGEEFSSLLHQLAAELAASPFNTNIRNILLEMSPTAKDRLPKRGGRKAAAAKPVKTKKKAVPPKKKTVKNTTAKAPTTKKKAEPGKKKAVSKKTAAKKKKVEPVKKKTGKKKAVSKKAVSKKAVSKKAVAKKAVKGNKKSASKQLARRKPR